MKLKSKVLMDNLIYVLACVLLFLYGMFFNSIQYYWVIAGALVIVIYKCTQVKALQFDINYCVLMETFFVKAVLDQQTGRGDIVPATVAMPVLFYLIGKMIMIESSQLKCTITLIASTLGLTIHGLLNHLTTNKVGLAGTGMYMDFSDKSLLTNEITYRFHYFFLLSVLLAGVIWFKADMAKNNEKVNSKLSWIVAVIILIVAVDAVVKYLQTDRFLALKQGVQLISTKYWGNFGLDLTYNNSTSNMWLDYGRDYGILVFVTLFIFFILTIKDAVKLALNKNVHVLTKSVLLFMAVFINVYYFIDSFAYIYPSYWYVGLIVCGAISEAANYKKTSK